MQLATAQDPVPDTAQLSPAPGSSRDQLAHLFMEGAVSPGWIMLKPAMLLSSSVFTLLPGPEPMGTGAELMALYSLEACPCMPPLALPFICTTGPGLEGTLAPGHAGGMRACSGDEVQQPVSFSGAPAGIHCGGGGEQRALI